MTASTNVTKNSGLKVISLMVTKEGKIERKMLNVSPQAQLAYPTDAKLYDDMRRQLVRMAPQIYRQQRGDANKIYSVHAPETECIAKRKLRKPFEFGHKVSVVTTRGNSGCWERWRCRGGPLTATRWRLRSRKSKR